MPATSAATYSDRGTRDPGWQDVLTLPGAQCSESVSLPGRGNAADGRFAVSATPIRGRRPQLRALRGEDVDFAPGSLRIRREKADDGEACAQFRTRLEAGATGRQET